MRVKILKNDSIGRYKAGEIGELLYNDFDKYDYKVDLGPLKLKEPVLMFDKTLYRIARVFYFYKYEVEVME